MALGALVAALVLTATVAPAPPSPPSNLGGNAQGSAVKVTAVTAAGKIAESQAADPTVVLDVFTRDDLCGLGTGKFMNEKCTGYAADTPVPTCEGLDPVPPVWHLHRDTPTSPWQQPTMALTWTCPQDALPVLTITDFRRLPITPSVLTIQPPRDEVAVNMPTIVYTDPTVQTFTTTVLTYPIEVEATPTRFTWDFGDGSDPIVTTGPGHPYPDHDIAYPYPREGTFTITLTTEFTGRFRIAGTTTWLPVTGTAHTTTTSQPITAVEHHTHLVSENCIENPHGPWCDDD